MSLYSVFRGNKKVDRTCKPRSRWSKIHACGIIGSRTDGRDGTLITLQTDAVTYVNIKQPELKREKLRRREKARVKRG